MEGACNMSVKEQKKPKHRQSKAEADYQDEVVGACEVRRKLCN